MGAFLIGLFVEGRDTRLPKCTNSTHLSTLELEASTSKNVDSLRGG